MSSAQAYSMSSHVSLDNALCRWQSKTIPRSGTTGAEISERHVTGGQACNVLEKKQGSEGTQITGRARCYIDE